MGGFVSAETLQFLEELEMQSDRKAYELAMKRYKKNKCKTISHEEFVKDIGL